MRTEEKNSLFDCEKRNIIEAVCNFALQERAVGCSARRAVIN
jgi:hypothetical protein